MQTTFLIRGTHCHSCKALIEDICLDQPGVQSCTVDWETGKTSVEHDESTDLKALTTGIEDSGEYKVELPL
jgi:copper chaperone CopZ